MRPSSSKASPSSITYAREIATGLAPIIARSFTVPFTASSPMSPPGNSMGLTTYGIGREGEPPGLDLDHRGVVEHAAGARGAERGHHHVAKEVRREAPARPVPEDHALGLGDRGGTGCVQGVHRHAAGRDGVAGRACRHDGGDQPLVRHRSASGATIGSGRASMPRPRPAE